MPAFVSVDVEVQKNFSSNILISFNQSMAIYNLELEIRNHRTTQLSLFEPFKAMHNTFTNIIQLFQTYNRG